ncbi:MAG: hypothetical protein VX555_01175 [Pseudomonadota bacterium]|nr:hypothetical protein [Pseudomonadota bacterium]
MTGHRLFAFVVMLGTVLCAHAGERHFRVGVGQEFSNVVAVRENGLHGPIASPYRCILEGSGYRFQFVTLPLARLVHELELGRIDLGLPLVQDSSRDRFAMFGDTVVKSSYLRISLSGTAGKPDEEKARYVYVRGFAGKVLLRDLAGRTFEVSEWQQAIAMLRLQRADYVLITEKTYGTLVESKQGDLRAEKVRDLDVAYYVRNSLPELARSLNRASDRCRQTQESPMAQVR